jgi:H+-translocating NAD(P) transhydrogenase subunit alpha
MTIAILKEPSFDARVAALPEAVQQLVKLKCTVIVQQGAGEQAFASDADYIAAGASIVSQQDALTKADLILSINKPEVLPQSKVMVGAYQPLIYPEQAIAIATSNNTSFSMDMIPRTTRAQAMDVLSSQANIAGYKAVLLAATEYCRYLPMFMTAAGSIPPAKVLILGAGVAGLQAIATAKRLGAVVEVFDTRPAVKEEVQSLGAKFVEVDGAADASAAGGYAVEQTEEYKQKQTQKIAEHVSKADIIITTAQIPGRKAPILISDDMIKSMRKGSVIIDLASATGGNTTHTQNNATVTQHNVRIIGNSLLAATAPSDASKVLGKNFINFIKLIITAEGDLQPNFDDELVIGTCITREGKVVHERLKQN